MQLTCVSEDMRGLAAAAGFAEGVHGWDEGERARLRAELDAGYFLLYGIERQEVEYILSTFSGAGKEGETIFGVGSQFDMILKSYDRMREGKKS